MVDLRATNLKLQQRSRNIIRNICGSTCPESNSELDDLLKSCGGSVKLAIAVLSLGVSASEAQQRLDGADGVLARILRESSKELTESPHMSRKDAEFVLCIDGGGSKCAAVVMSPDGAYGYGETGACNVTDIGVDAAVLSIALAVQRACDSHPHFMGREWQSDQFSSIWVALAGHDRKEIASVVDRALENLFKRPIGENLEITNDIELLACSAAGKYKVDSAVVLVAGTGSVAVRYARRNGRFVRSGRSGGWGHLLGDDGSGFNIGRQAIRLALRAVDEYDLQGRAQSEVAKFAPLVQRILDHFRPKGIADDVRYDLVSAVLSSPSDQEKKQRIASVARIVVEMSPQDQQAKMIVGIAAKSLVSMLDPMLQAGGVAVEEAVLILAGGLIRGAPFESALKGELADAGFRFKEIEVVNQPALMGAGELLRRRFQTGQVKDL